MDINPVRPPPYEDPPSYRDLRSDDTVWERGVNYSLNVENVNQSYETTENNNNNSATEYIEPSLGYLDHYGSLNVGNNDDQYVNLCLGGGARGGPRMPSSEL